MAEKADNPHRFALKYLDFKVRPCERTFHFWQGSLYEWWFSRYEEVSEDDMLAKMSRYVHDIYRDDWEREYKEGKARNRGTTMATSSLSPPCGP